MQIDIIIIKTIKGLKMQSMLVSLIVDLLYAVSWKGKTLFFKEIYIACGVIYNVLEFSQTTCLPSAKVNVRIEINRKSTDRSFSQVLEADVLVLRCLKIVNATNEK